jgi:hypothetical protein
MIEVNAFLNTTRIGNTRLNNTSNLVPFLESFRLVIPRRLAPPVQYLIGTGGGGSIVVTVPVTGQIYPRIINI